MKNVRKVRGCLLSTPINLSFFECTCTDGHTLGFSSNKSSRVGVLWFHVTSTMTISFFECTCTNGHTLGLSSNKSFGVGVLWFHVTSKMTILVVPLSG
jgi:hypothetical protein